MDAPKKTCAGRIRPARMSDVRPIHALLASFAAKGLMKDRFHYLQPAYNAVGAEARQQVGSLWGR